MKASSLLLLLVVGCASNPLDPSTDETPSVQMNDLEIRAEKSMAACSLESARQSPACAWALFSWMSGASGVVAACAKLAMKSCLGGIIGSSWSYDRYRDMQDPWFMPWWNYQRECRTCRLDGPMQGGL